jgi:hypothetical protein
MHGVHVAYFATAPTAVANGGVACETRLLWHLIMRWVASDFGSKARGRKRKQNFSSPTARPGQEEEETVPPQNNTVSSLFFCFFKRMKRHHFALNASFHLNENWHQSARFQVNPSICARFAFWSLVSYFFY